jgi:TP901 family phage tail tape measure protein
MANFINFPIVSKFDDTGVKKAEGSLSNLGKVAAGIAAAATAAVVGIATASIKEFAKFDDKLNQSLAIMGDVSETMRGEMSDAARQVAKETTFSADQAAESFFFLASAGLDAASAVKSMPQVAKFAQAGMFDMARATDLLTDAQSALGMVIKDDANANLVEMTRLSDVLVKANTLANASVEQFSTALTTKAGASLKQFGKDAEEGVAVLAALADQGIKGELAGTNLSIAIRDLTSKALSNGKAFEKFNVSVFDGEGKMRNMADIVGDLERATDGMSDAQKKATFTQLGFSDKSMGTLAALIGTSDAIRTYEKELRNAGGTTEEISNKQLESFSAQMELLKSRVADVGIEIGGPLASALLEMADDLEPVIEELGPALVEFFKALMPVIKAVIGVLPQIFSLAAPALNALTALMSEQVIPVFQAMFGFIKDNIPTIATFVGVLGTLLLAFNAIRIATAAWAVVQGVLNAIMALNPLVLVAIAVAALTAGIVYLATKTTFFQDTWQAMTEFVSNAWQGFSDLFTSIGEGLASFFGTIGENLALGWEATMGFFSTAVTAFSETFKKVWGVIGGFFKTIVNGYIGIWEGFINGVIGGVNAIVRALNGLQVTLPSWIPGLGGKTFGVNLPQVPTMRIPRLADGGIVMPTPGGVLANIAEAGKPEAVIPLDRMGDFGGNSKIEININAGIGSDPVSIGREVVNAIKRYEAVSGKVFATA